MLDRILLQVMSKAEADTDKVVLHIPILYSGWEMDNDFFVLERLDGSKYLLTSDHGSFSICTSYEVLHEKLKEANMSASKLQNALVLLKENQNGS